MKTIIVLVLFAILAALFTAGIFLVKDKGDSRRGVWMLTLRISLSVGLIIFILLAATMGWIEPHGIIPPRPES